MYACKVDLDGNFRVSKLCSALYVAGLCTYTARAMGNNIDNVTVCHILVNSEITPILVVSGLHLFPLSPDPIRSIWNRE